jgi:hypothetical protein
VTNHFIQLLKMLLGITVVLNFTIEKLPKPLIRIDLRLQNLFFLRVEIFTSNSNDGQFPLKNILLFHKLIQLPQKQFPAESLADRLIFLYFVEAILENRIPF